MFESINIRNIFGIGLYEDLRLRHRSIHPMADLLLRQKDAMLCKKRFVFFCHRGEHCFLSYAFQTL